jgi:hypothetical protein
MEMALVFPMMSTKEPSKIMIQRPGKSRSKKSFLVANHKNGIGKKELPVFPKPPEKRIIHHINNLTPAFVFHCKGY